MNESQRAKEKERKEEVIKAQSPGPETAEVFMKETRKNDKSKDTSP